jgi:hypothetical protein
MRAKLALVLHLGGVGKCRRLIRVWSVQAQSWMRTCTHIRNQGIYTQLIEGSGAFRLIYDIKEGELNVELVLKTSCCGKDTLSSYVAGVHFTEDDIRSFGLNKKVNGRALWAMGLTACNQSRKLYPLFQNCPHGL